MICPPAKKLAETFKISTKSANLIRRIARADNAPEWLPIVRPCYQAAGLVFAALRALGEYPADSPDYDPVAVDHLRQALQRLAPGLGNMEILGAPHPVKPRSPIASQRPARDDETQEAPVATARIR